MYTFTEHRARSIKQFTFAILVLTASACNNGSDHRERKDGFTPLLETREDSLYHDVMEGHDVGMAKMSTLRKHITRVQQELDSINKLPAAKVDKQYKQALTDLQEDLSYADNAMFTWMQEFEVDSARSDKDRRVAYLESERMKVEKVRDNILNSLRRADSLFEKQR